VDEEDRIKTNIAEMIQKIQEKFPQLEVEVEWNILNESDNCSNKEFMEVRIMAI
jgi:uncharacterized protein YdhG (YjbR/CyaY superfamily)